MDYLGNIQNKTLKIIYKVIISVQRFAAMLVGIAVPLIVVYQVLLRYVFKSPLMGIEELLIFFIIWLYMLGGSVASEQRNHIECGILTLYIKKDSHMKLFRCFKSVFSMAVCAWLLYWGYWYFSYSLKMWKISDILHIPMFFGESAIFIGFLLMFFFGMLELIDNFVAYAKCREEKAE
ncbi:MAG: TRAP transporter small permease subunit [Candidatus Pelethousia sp.]|nr:TRAP transporter small permease subunit [Candidatus Pelethousia sp.]